jgi:hypothetical protein
MTIRRQTDSERCTTGPAAPLDLRVWPRHYGAGDLPFIRETPRADSNSWRLLPNSW